MAQVGEDGIGADVEDGIGVAVGAYMEQRLAKTREVVVRKD